MHFMQYPEEITNFEQPGDRGLVTTTDPAATGRSQNPRVQSPVSVNRLRLRSIPAVDARFTIGDTASPKRKAS